MKIAIIFGKGLDGCGVTRGAREIQMWGTKYGFQVDVFVFSERKFIRGSGHKVEYTDFVTADIPSISEKLEEYDLVYLNSYPSASNSKAAIDAFFYDLVLKIKEPVILGMMGEITPQNINKMPHFMGLMNACDVIWTFTEDCYFATTAAKMLPSKKLGERIKKFTMWLNFDDETEDLRNNISLTDKNKELLYLGRWTTMKDPRRVLDMGPALNEIGVPGRLLGIERSIGAKSDIFDHPFTLDLTGKNPSGNPDGVPVHGPYIRHEGLEKMANTLFGCSFYRMPKDPKGYGDRHEYTQIEIIAVGSIPVFDLHWAENNRIKTGERYIDIPYSGIYSDKLDLQGTIDQINEVANSFDLQKKIRNTSYDIIRSEYDAEHVLPEMFEHVLSLGKDKDKFKTIDEMLLFITNNEDFVEAYNEQKDKGELVALGLGELSTGKIAVFKDKRRDEVASFKIGPKTKAKSILQF